MIITSLRLASRFSFHSVFLPFLYILFKTGIAMFSYVFILSIVVEAMFDLSFNIARIKWETLVMNEKEKNI